MGYRTLTKTWGIPIRKKFSSFLRLLNDKLRAVLRFEQGVLAPGNSSGITLGFPTPVAITAQTDNSVLPIEWHDPHLRARVHSCNAFEPCSRSISYKNLLKRQIPARK